MYVCICTSICKTEFGRCTAKPCVKFLVLGIFPLYTALFEVYKNTKHMLRKHVTYSETIVLRYNDSSTVNTKGHVMYQSDG